LNSIDALDALRCFIYTGRAKKSNPLGKILYFWNFSRYVYQICRVYRWGFSPHILQILLK